jgi:uncharacterized membrane protein YpjA
MNEEMIEVHFSLGLVLIRKSYSFFKVITFWFCLKYGFNLFAVILITLFQRH